MALSATATTILERMERNRGYHLEELRAFAPDLSVDAIQDVMRELWVKRYVERFGYTGWRRERSTSPAEIAHGYDDHPNRLAGAGGRAASKPPVKPEDLFDHSEFEGIFK